MDCSSDATAAAAAAEPPAALRERQQLKRKAADTSRSDFPARKQRVVVSPAQKPLPSAHVAFGAVAAASSSSSGASARAVAAALGLQYGLRLFANQWAAESGRAACKRLLFQQALNGQSSLIDRKPPHRGAHMLDSQSILFSLFLLQSVSSRS